MAKTRAPTQCYYFDVVKGRQDYMVNFSARNHSHAVVLARRLIPDFDLLRWVQWWWTEGEKDWKTIAEEPRVLANCVNNILPRSFPFS